MTKPKRKENHSTDQAKQRIKAKEHSDDWCIDSGTSSHMCNDVKFFKQISTGSNHPVELPDGTVISAKGIGCGSLSCINEKDEIQEIFMKNVLFVPELETNLLSVRKLTKLGFKVNFEGDNCLIREDSTIIATGSIDKDNLYRLNVKEKANKVKCNNEVNCIHKWHRRFGHRDPDAVKKLTNHDMVYGMKIDSCKTKSVCECCIQGKMTRSPFTESTTKSESIFDLVHSDLCPLPKASIGNKKHILTFIDDYSRYTKIYLLEHKHETFGKFKEFHRGVETQFSKKLKILRTDRGGEYIDGEFRQFLLNEGIESQLTAPSTPEQNGVAERKNRYLIEMARCLLIDSKLNSRYWGEAVNTANYLQNRLPSRTIPDNKTPYEMLYNKKPNVDHIRIFGCTAYAHVPKAFRQKLDSKANKMVLVGYSNESKAYRLLDPKTSKIVISRDVRFIEDHHETPIDGISEHVEDEEIDISEFLDSETETEDTNTTNEIIEATNEVANDIQHEDRNNEVQEDNANIRRSVRVTRGIPPERFKANKVTCDIYEPKTYEEAVSCHNKNEWTEAIKNEMDSLIENGTWELTELPQGRKAIGCKWTFKVKTGANGEIIRYKSRLVAQGFSQKYGEDYDEVFAPVVKHTTIRTLLVIAGKEKMKVRHYDIKTAFLNGELKEDIYMKQPKGFIEKGKEHLACHLKRTLYGLKQSARAWNEKMNGILLDYGFKRGEADNCLYTKFVNDVVIYLLIFIDDIIMACKHEHLMDQVETKIGESVEIKSMGNLHFYLGVAIERDKEGIFYISQKQYIMNILKKYRLEDAKPSKIPLDPGYGKRSEIHDPMKNPDIYRSAVGSLLYLTVNTRPDIAVSASILGRKKSNPTESDWVEVKRVIRYLKGTIDYKLKLGGDEEVEQDIVGYADADWGGDNKDRKSTSGQCFQIQGGTVSWSSRKQDCVSLSSKEAEYVSLSEACQELIWLQNLLKDFHIGNEKNVMYEDNQGCIKSLSCEKFSAKSKHIEIKYHFAKDLKKKNRVNFQYCPTESMTADMLTKPLESVKLRKLIQLIGLGNFKIT